MNNYLRLNYKLKMAEIDWDMADEEVVEYIKEEEET